MWGPSFSKRGREACFIFHCLAHSLNLGLFDGAAKMSGVRCGVQVLVSKEESRALYFIAWHIVSI